MHTQAENLLEELRMLWRRQERERDEAKVRAESHRRQEAAGDEPLLLILLTDPGASRGFLALLSLLCAPLTPHVFHDNRCCRHCINGTAAHHSQ